MTDDLERQLGAAFDAQARSVVRDGAPIPAARFLDDVRQRRRWIAPVAAAAAVLAVAGSVLGLQAASDEHQVPATGHSAPPVATGQSVHIRMVTVDGASYGVGMPVVAYFSKRFVSAQPLAAATSVTVNGKPAQAAWYFERSARAGFPVEGQLRMRTYWPAHASVHVSIGSNEVTAGTALDFRTGARTVATVNDAKHQLIVTRDGKWLGAYPVSLGLASTPTMRGTKIIMNKQPSICVHGVAGPGSYNECGIKMAQQLTYDGEYLLAAPWNEANIKSGVDTSNGCTNLLPTDARRLYNLFQVGDVIKFPDASGPSMRAGTGLGDWNVPWPTWQRGGLISTG